jgi:hypothetical protein
VSSTATAPRRFGDRPRSGALFDLAVAIGVLAGSLVLLSHGGIEPSHPGEREIDLVGVVLVACSTVPLVAWRRFPLGVFAATAAAGVLLAGFDYPLDLLLGPIAALYLLAASRGPETPWTGRTTGTVVGLLMAYVGATAAAQGTFPGIEPFHNGAGNRSLRSENGPCGPSGRSNVSGCSPPPRSGPASPAICTIPPATPSA